MKLPAAVSPYLLEAQVLERCWRARLDPGARSGSRVLWSRTGRSAGFPCTRSLQDPPKEDDIWGRNESNHNPAVNDLLSKMRKD